MIHSKLNAEDRQMLFVCVRALNFVQLYGL